MSVSSGLPLVLLSALFFSACPVDGAADEGVPVVVSPVQHQQIFRQVEITGSVSSARVAQLSPAISGLVSELYVDEGDYVSAGDTLLELDPELAQWQWQGAEAVQKQAAAAASDSRRRLTEAEHLAPQRSIAKTAVMDLEAEVAEDTAALDRARAGAQYQHAIVERHRVKAPFAGVISNKLTEQGEWVSQGQGVFELVATDVLRLDFAVAEVYLAGLTPNTPVQFSLSAIAGQLFEGRVQTVVPVTDPGARTFLLRVVATQKVESMLPGMSAHAILRIPEYVSAGGAEAGKGLTVPRDAIIRYPDSRVVVWRVEPSEAGLVARENLVQLGQSFDGMVEIRQGLGADARVVVQGNEALQDGQRVRIVADSSADGGTSQTTSVR